MSQTTLRKVVLCGTHPNQFNGYSKVVYELAKELSENTDIELYIYGFQNFYKKPDHEDERKLPKVKEIYDPHAHEEPKAKGFGDSLIIDYVKRVQPDIVIIYNDLVVITSLMNKLREIPNRDFKLVAYIDIVYKNEKNNMIRHINEHVDAGIMFTSYWKDVIIKQGFTKPLYTLEHGFNSQTFYPIEKSVARRFFNINPDDFVIVNLNRNQPRKRWDICLMAFVKYISTHQQDNIKLLIATTLNGGWDLVDIMISECRKYDMTLEDIKKHLIIIQNPQQITDREINVLYNVADIGVNTCDGEGFGLCNFEQAGVGIPQIVPKLGGFLDFLTNERSIMIQPKWSYYTDHSRDFVSGEAEVCDVDDFVKAFDFYYKRKDLVASHGKLSRDHIMNNYGWDKISNKMHAAIRDICKDMAPKKTATPAEEVNEVSIESIDSIDIDALIERKLNGGEETDIPAQDATPTPKEEPPPTPKEEPPQTPNVVQILDDAPESSSFEEVLKKNLTNDDDDDDDEVIVVNGGS